MIFKHGILAALLGVVLAARPFPAAAGATIDVKAGFIRAPHVQETVSILDIPAADDGIAGAKLAAEDNNTTGRFLGQTLRSRMSALQPGDDPAAALNGLLQQRSRLSFSPTFRRRRFSRSPRRQRTRGS